MLAGYAKSADPDEMTCHLIRIFTVCYLVLDFCLISLFATMDMSKVKDGRVHCRKPGMKALRGGKAWDESVIMVNTVILG